MPVAAALPWNSASTCGVPDMLTRPHPVEVRAIGAGLAGSIVTAATLVPQHPGADPTGMLAAHPSLPARAIPDRCFDDAPEELLT